MRLVRVPLAALPDPGAQAGLAGEVNRGGVGAADNHTDMLVRAGGVGAGAQRGQRRAGAWLGDDPQAFPQQLLGGQDRVITDQDNGVNELGRDGQRELTDLARRE